MTLLPTTWTPEAEVVAYEALAGVPWAEVPPTPPGAPTTTRPDPWISERRPRPDPWRRAK